LSLLVDISIPLRAEHSDMEYSFGSNPATVVCGWTHLFLVYIYSLVNPIVLIYVILLTLSSCYCFCAFSLWISYSWPLSLNGTRHYSVMMLCSNIVAQFLVA